MISCKHCQTQNGLDAKFCKNCGLGLPDDVILQASQKHEQMVQEGYTLFNAGRTSEALLIAHAAVEENPNSANAQSLLGMCFERMGQMAEALECFERVLIMSPDSALDRMKVTQLRTSLTNHMRTDSKRNQTFAAAAGVSMVVVVIAAGLIVANLGTPKAVAQTIAPPATTEAKTFPTTVQGAMVSSPQQTAPATNVPPQPVDVPTRVQGLLNNRSHEANNIDSSQNDDPGPTLQPVHPNGFSNITAVPSPNPTTDKSADPPPVVDTGKKSDVTQDPPVRDPDGYIQIQVTQPRASSQESDGGSPNQLAALMKAAKNQFIVGQFEKAAQSYQRALQNGGDPGIINQRLGMCYEKLEKKNEAISAYSQAANSYKGSISSGRGDSKRLKSGLDSVNQALKLLKG